MSESELDIDERELLSSARVWRAHGQPADGTIDRNAYVFCVLTQFPPSAGSPGDLRAGFVEVA